MADSLRTGPFQRGVDRKQSQLWKEIGVGSFDRSLARRNGIDLGMVLKVPFGRGPVKDSITHIVRGLYYKLLNKRLPDDHTFLVGGMGGSASCIRTLESLQRLGPVGIAAIGDHGKFDVFSSFCATWFREEDGLFAASIWGLAFYDRMNIGCVTIPEKLKDQLNPRYLE